MVTDGFFRSGLSFHTERAGNVPFVVAAPAQYRPRALAVSAREDGRARPRLSCVTASATVASTPYHRCAAHRNRINPLRRRTNERKMFLPSSEESHVTTHRVRLLAGTPCSALQLLTASPSSSARTAGFSKPSPLEPSIFVES